MRSKKSLWRFVALLAALALVAAACGGDDDTSETTTTTTAAPAETTTTAAETTETTAAPEPAEGQLSGMTVIDENTFSVELLTADPEFRLRLGFAACVAVPPQAFDDPAAFGEFRGGGGPVSMAAPWEHDVRISLERYADYQGPDPAKIDTFD